MWKVCFKVPYATILWQVGDASEQISKFKIEGTREKGNLMTYKCDKYLRSSLEPEDIMPLLNLVFSKSFGNVRSNKKAIANCGWNPPNCTLLEHPSLITEDKGRSSSASTTELAVMPALNVQEGMSSATVLD